jgi:multidrug efflux pump subunit AcrA (membrane-fusion protein)
MSGALRRRLNGLRRAVGLAAILLLGILALLATPQWGDMRQKALVDADQTFRLNSLEGGVHGWSLRSGWPAEGEALVREQVLELERSDLVELEIDPSLSPGDEVQEGQEVAWLRSPRDERRLTELQAMRSELEAQLDLLGAGQRPEEVAEARQRVRLAQAAWEGHQLELERIRRLHGDNAVSSAELEQAEVQDRLLALELEVAKAARRVTESSARPEEIQGVQAQIEGLEARISELEGRLAGLTIRSPITGLLEMGGRRVVLRVYDLDPVYLRIALPEADRHRMMVGAPVRFRSPAVANTIFEGSVVDISEDAATVNGGQVFWVSAEVPNTSLLLRSGMSGVARIELDVHRRGLLAGLWDELMGFGE